MTDTNNTTLLNTHSVDDAFIAKIKQAYEKAGLLAHTFNEAAGTIPGNTFTIKYLSDNGDKADDLAVTEIQSRFSDYSNIISALSKRSKPTVQIHNTPAQDSTGGAYDLAQIARDNGRGLGNVVFLNCAPRKKQRGNHDNNQGEQVYIGMLRDGTVIGATGEESFTFFRDVIERGDLELYKANVQTSGSQFRSRDYWPLYTLTLIHQLRDLAQEGKWQADLSKDERKALLSQLNIVDTNTVADIDAIPKASDTPAVVRYDVHDNLKLNIRASDLPEDLSAVNVTINGITETLSLGKSMFKEGAGRLSFSEGSTGQWPDHKRANINAAFEDVAIHDGVEWTADPQGFLQIAVINGSAKNHFKVTDEQLRAGNAIAKIEQNPQPDTKPTKQSPNSCQDQQIITL